MTFLTILLIVSSIMIIAVLLAISASKKKKDIKNNEDTIDLQKISKDALLQVASEKAGRELTQKEKDHISSVVDEAYNDKEITDDDPEILELLRLNAVEEMASKIRTVVGCYTDIKENPFPYVVKKHLQLLKDSHAFILKSIGTDLYKEGIEHARKEMFEGEEIWDNLSEVMSFFNFYTSNPSSFKMSSIKNLLSEKYQHNIENLF